MYKDKQTTEFFFLFLFAVCFQLSHFNHLFFYFVFFSLFTPNISNFQHFSPFIPQNFPPSSLVMWKMNSYELWFLVCAWHIFSSNAAMFHGSLTEIPISDILILSWVHRYFDSRQIMSYFYVWVAISYKFIFLKITCFSVRFEVNHV